MLPRRYRLRKASDFQRIRRSGRCWSSELLVLCKAENAQDQTRFGFSVSKRVGNAVTRNRVKRLLREAARRYCDLVSPGNDILLIAKPSSSSADYWKIEREMVRLLSMAGLFHPDKSAVE